jgi:hypothetical protein
MPDVRKRGKPHPARLGQRPSANHRPRAVQFPLLLLALGIGGKRRIRHRLTLSGALASHSSHNFDFTYAGLFFFLLLLGHILFRRPEYKSKGHGNCESSTSPLPP